MGRGKVITETSMIHQLGLILQDGAATLKTLLSDCNESYMSHRDEEALLIVEINSTIRSSFTNYLTESREYKVLG